jgi:G3E family GTPase
MARGSQHEGRFDYVLVETTGLANPGPIIAELWTDEELEAGASLDGVVTLVDGRNIGRQLSAVEEQQQQHPRVDRTGCEAALQVALADVILLNKMDLLSPEEAEAVRTTLRGINAAADIVATTHSAVDLGLLLNRGAYRMRGGRSVAHAWLLQQQAQEPQELQLSSSLSSHECSSASSPCALVHDAGVRTLALRAPAPVDVAALRVWLEGLIWSSGSGSGSSSSIGSTKKKPELMRAKGVLDVAGSDNAHLLQAVYELYDIVPVYGLRLWCRHSSTQTQQQQCRVRRGSC